MRVIVRAHATNRLGHSPKALLSRIALCDTSMPTTSLHTLRLYTFYCLISVVFFVLFLNILSNKIR